VKTVASLSPYRPKGFALDINRIPFICGINSGIQGRPYRGLSPAEFHVAITDLQVGHYLAKTNRATLHHYG